MNNILIENFREHITGLKEFVSLIDPFLDKHTLSIGDKHKDVLDALKNAIDSKNLSTEVKENEATTGVEENENDLQIEIIENKENDGKTILKVKGKKSENLDIALKDLQKSFVHKNILYKNSLLNLLSSVEWFFSQLLHYKYDKFPNSAGINNKTLTLEEIKAFGSIKDAEKYLIESKIEEVLRGSISDWFKLCKEQFKIKMKYLDDFESNIIEIYQRRNIIIHNGGVVNSIYVAKVSQEHIKDVKIGDVLTVDKEYLHNAIFQLELVFVMIAFEVWESLEKDNEERAEPLMSFAYHYIKHEHWKEAELVNSFLFNDKFLPIVNRTSAQLNIWLCKKELGQYEDVRDIIDKTDFSDKQDIFQLALYSIKDDKENFFEVLPIALKNESIDAEDLFEFPIFKYMRSEPEFAELCKTNEHILSYLNEN